MKNNRKKFKDTKVFSFLSNKLPVILDIADDYVPPLKVLTTLLKSVPDSQVNDEDIRHIEYLYAKEKLEPGMKWWLSRTVWAATTIITCIILTATGIEIPAEVIAFLGALGLLAARFPSNRV